MAAPEPQRALFGPPEATPAPPPTRIARTVVILLGLFGLASGLGILSDLEQWGVLSDARIGDFELARAEASDLLSLLAALLQLAAAIMAAAPFAMWILRANRTARVLSPGQVDTSPGWALGWYFVPIANLWKPYQAMREIHAASLPPGVRRSSPLLPLWWGLALGFAALTQVANRSAAHAGSDLDRLTSTIQLELASDIVAVLLALVAACMVQQISRLQAERAGD